MPESADPDSEWVEVFSTDTGRKQTVPRSWLDNPVLSQGIRKTPLSAAQQRDADALIEAAGSTETPDAGGKE